MTTSKNIRIAALLLRYSFAAFLLVIGGDKVLHTQFISDWEFYVGPLATHVFPFAPATVVKIQGCIELAYAAMLLFTPFVRTAMVLFIVSILCVIVDLYFLRINILILRDLMIIVAGIALILIWPEAKKLKKS